MVHQVECRVVVCCVDPLVVVLPQRVHGVVVGSGQYYGCSDDSRDEYRIASEEVGVQHIRRSTQHSGGRVGPSSQLASERRLRLSGHTATGNEQHAWWNTAQHTDSNRSSSSSQHAAHVITTETGLVRLFLTFAERYPRHARHSWMGRRRDRTTRAEPQTQAPRADGGKPHAGMRKIVGDEMW